jgi:hypothetical protein
MNTIERLLSIKIDEKVIKINGPKISLASAGVVASRVATGKRQRCLRWQP